MDLKRSSKEEFNIDVEQVLKHLKVNIYASIYAFLIPESLENIDQFWLYFCFCDPFHGLKLRMMGFVAHVNC